ncbi:enoyl-CoA hydratase/carnithine racemase [Vararia minispora EC-137]|uniref:Enoyl-CoA hydratase/carnithine racemase n=1 Tax=Vararia minispora EC-137 TaxID=1314806 RepID=A0ACB8QHF5_9AGAM|nr:enoyl-CoA hydratase/carnithine racemase [Vararia minispora EC-137]
MALQLPSHSDQVKVSFPVDHVLMLCMNRPKALNAMSDKMEHDLKTLLNWFDEEPSLWVVIVTGEGRAFCAGADLKSWNTRQQGGDQSDSERIAASIHGFGSLSRRVTSKPIIAAVNGGVFGGGMEMVLNCDLVIASDQAVFAMPEVKRGVIAGQGAIPRIRVIAGHQLAAEMLLLGRTVGAAEAHQRFGLRLIETAVHYAKEITQNSPDAVQATKRGLILAAQNGNIERAVIDHSWSAESKRAYNGANIKEGLKAFTEKRLPRWTNPAKL